MSKKILIVEDEESVVNAIEDVLNKENILVMRAKNGQEGLEIAISEKPDLLLVDIVMPIMDGWTMLRKLREGDEYMKNVPVIMLTNLGADNEEAIKNIAGIRPKHYIIKSDISVKDIVGKIKEILK